MVSRPMSSPPEGCSVMPDVAIPTTVTTPPPKFSSELTGKFENEALHVLQSCLFKSAPQN